MQYIKIPLTPEVLARISPIVPLAQLESGGCTFFGFPAEICEDLSAPKRALTEIEERYGEGETVKLAQRMLAVAREAR